MKKKVYSLMFAVYSWVFICLLLCNHSFAQSERKLVRDGNKLYKEKKYTDAEVNYMKSLNVNKDSKTAKFNLGDAYYKQDKYEEASKQFQSIAEDKSVSKDDQYKAFHNLGNSLLKEKKYEESINAYKNSLKLNSKDNDTRYNLAYAQSMIKQQQQQQQQKKNDQNKDQKKQDQKKQDQQKQGDQKKGDKQQQQKQEQQQQAQKKQGISKEDAEKMLQALNNDEKNTQKKLVKKPSSRISIEKQW